MFQQKRSVVMLLIVVTQLGCGGSYQTKYASSTSPSPNISLSPASATAGSPDLDVTITASGQFTFSGGAHKNNYVLWSAGGTDTSLRGTFVSSSKLTIQIPAALLATQAQAKVHVEVWDWMGDVPDYQSSTVTFSVN